MKRFRFRLEKVLNLRAKEEDLVKLELKEALSLLNRCEQELMEIKDRIREGAALILKERLSPSMDLPKILVFEQGMERLLLEKDYAKQRLLQAEEEADRVREKLKQATLDRKKLELVGDKHKKRHQAQERKEEQVLIDEVAVVRFADQKQ